MTWWRAVYCLATWAALPWVLIYFAWRSRREPAYRRHWGERLGYTVPQNDRPIWVHAASVGEVVLVGPLVNTLRARWPSRPIVLSTVTPTGRAEAERRFGDSVRLTYLPLDTWGATQRFIRRIQPAIAILAETELWPNLIAAADQRKVPLVLVNATMSARSAERFQHWLLARAARFMLSRFSLIAAASEEHAQRLIGLGASARATRASGNLKFDQPLPPDQADLAATLRRAWQAEDRAVWVAASTHAGEEEALLRVFERLRAARPDLLWVLAPRHPQRFDQVARLLEDSGWQYARRSQGEPVKPATDIVLADTLGEVPLFYASADMAFVGGSLVPGIGGHNVIEPAAVGCALATGPFIREWQTVLEALAEVGGAFVASDETALADQLAAWLADSERCRRDGQSGAALVGSRRGVLDRIMEPLAPLLPPSHQ